MPTRSRRSRSQVVRQREILAIITTAYGADFWWNAQAAAVWIAR